MNIFSVNKDIVKLNILFFVIISMVLQSPAYAIKDKNNTTAIDKSITRIHKVKKPKQVSPFSSPAQVNLNIDKQTLVSKINFDDVYNTAKGHFYDITIADFDILISKQDIRGARADYMPKLYFGASTEYNKSFNGDIRMTTTVGDTYINPYTRYQSVLGFTLSYNLFDFGVRRGRLDMAKEDVILKSKIEKQKMQELELNVIDAYTKVLMNKKQIDINTKILALEKRNLEMKTRLFNAKEISRMDLNAQKVEVQKTEKKINELKSHLAESLNLLSFYTGQNYDEENIVISEIATPNINPFEFSDITKTLVWDVQESIIDKKYQELKIIRRTNFPKLNIYSKYYLYGQDMTSYIEANKLSPSNWAIGASLSMPIFDGMKNLADIKKAKLEIEKLEYEKARALAEYRNKLLTMRSNLVYIDKQIKNDKTILNDLSAKNNDMKRLLSKRVVSPVEAAQAEVDLLNQQIEYQNNYLTRIAIIKGIQAITTYDRDEILNGKQRTK